MDTNQHPSENKIQIFQTALYHNKFDLIKNRYFNILISTTYISRNKLDMQMHEIKLCQNTKNDVNKIEPILLFQS